MSLDQNLFTLVISPNKEDPNVVDLVDPSGTIHYRKQRVAGPVYTIEVYDFVSESLLITATAPAATSKTKTLVLCNPTTAVELKFTGTLTFRWSFKWEEHELEWKREECFLIRKPDPPVLVAITKEPSGRLKTSSIQILDYNLNRFEINDRKGLEIVILTALLTFQDSNEAHHSKEASPKGTPTTSVAPIVMSPPVALSPPPLPAKPEPPSGVDRIAEIQAVRHELNEVVVEDEGEIDDYAKYSWNLLQDDAMLFVIIQSQSKEQVQKVVQVVEEVKRLHHKAGLEDELHQYVSMDSIRSAKGPKRINLDDKKERSTYQPPESIRIHLSKIPLPELQPKPSSTREHMEDPSGKSKEKVKEKERSEKKDKEREKRKEKKEKEKEQKKGKVTSTVGSPTASPPKLAKQGHSRKPSSPPRSPNVHSHQVHPHQPTPSPSQLHNPGIYVAPPPPPVQSRPRVTPPPGALQAQSRLPPGPISTYSPYPQPQPPTPLTPANAVSGFLNMLQRH